jgi:LmbE family N-acetylglucosaminyl deacetylase
LHASSAPGPSRRLLLAGLGTGAASMALAACSVPESPRRGTPAADPLPGKAISIDRHERLMQILAHPDDDLYFMNPDTQRMLDAGTPLVCVYVTAGEATGINVIAGRPHPRPDKPAYSSARHQGLRQAYATLLGLAPFTPWTKGVTELRGGHRAEINTLAGGGRRVELIFLNLAMHTTIGRYLGLPSLWAYRGLNLRTVVAEGSPLQTTETYTYDALVDVLTGLLTRYRPTVVHTMDPDPDIQHSPTAVRRKDSEQLGYSDHADHTATASFSWAALIRWIAEATTGGGDIPAFVTTAYRGYYNRHWPKNLSRKVLLEKASHLVPYGGNAAWECGNPGGCGDYNVGVGRPLTNKKGWVRSTHYRYPGPRPVLAAEADGRLVGYGVLGLRAVRWRETTPGSGQWGPPDDLGGGPLAPTLGAATLPDGKQLLFGLRFDALAGHGAANTREVVLLQQRTPGGEFGAWTGLGNPEAEPDSGRRIGVPVAVTTPDEQVHLFVRNAAQGISSRVRDTAGRWGGWRDLGGGQIQDGLCAAVDAVGLVHVFAAGRDTVHHWVQSTPGGPLAVHPEPVLPLPGDSPTAVAARDGGVDVYYPPPASSKITAVHLGGSHPGARPLSPALAGQDDRGRVRLLQNGQVIVRSEGVVPLEGTALHIAAGRDRELTVAGLGPGALPWMWRPVRAV